MGVFKRVPHKITKRQVSVTGEVSYSLPPVAPEALLGKNAKSVDEGYQQRRSERFRLLDVARRLLPDERVATCMCRCGSGGVSVRVSPSTGVAGFAGVATCGSVWACPVCAARIANERREELNRALVWAREGTITPVMLTLTTRHGIDDDLAVSLAKLKAAKQRFHQSRSWRVINAQLAGHITATEVTHGRAGWHPHYHVLLFVRNLADAAACELVEQAREAWTMALLAQGLDCNEYGYHVQNAAAAGDYITKWGAGEELTLAGVKKGDPAAGGRSPLQLLQAYSEGDQRAGALYAEFARVFKGRRQLVWSRGFKDLLKIAELTDEEVAALPELPDMEDVYYIDREVWTIIVNRRLQAELLHVAELGQLAGEARWYIECWLDALVTQWQMGVR